MKAAEDERDAMKLKLQYETEQRKDLEGNFSLYFIMSIQ